MVQTAVLLLTVRKGGSYDTTGRSGSDHSSLIVTGATGTNVNDVEVLLIKR
ncbi:MAG: hypothetical protein K2M70_04215 [Lachnospiraceae bacterium]|nr:hypothetical protein [Lachnospiraceae bacterium]